MVLWLHEEEAVDAPYIQAVLAEFEAACETCTVAVPAKLRVLSLDVALQQGNTSQVYSRGAGGLLFSSLRSPHSPICSGMNGLNHKCEQDRHTYIRWCKVCGSNASCTA